MRKLGKICLYSVAGLIGLLLMLVLALKIALDRAPAYQAEIKEWIHAQTGYHVAFARVSPSFRWYGPELHFESLELRSKDNRRVLARAAGGRVAADIWQLLKTGKLLAGRIELISPDIVITRLGPESFAIASEIKLDGEGSTLDRLALNDLPAGKLAIRHAVVTLQNWNAALPHLTIQGVDVDLKRGDANLSAAVRARLPPELGGSVAISATLSGRGEFDTLDWNALVGAREVSFPGWRLLLPEYLSSLDGGDGAFDLALRGTGRELERADLEFGARGVLARTASGPSARYDEISGTLSIVHAGDRWSLEGKRLRAVRSGHLDPDSKFDVSWHSGAGGEFDLRGRASYLRADNFLPLSGLVPDEGFRDRLHEIAPTGELMDSAIELARAGESAPWRFEVRARFRDLGFAPMGKIPGLRGLTGTLAGSERGGRVAIDSAAAQFHWPQQLPEPIPLDRLTGTIYWKRDADGLLVATPALTFGNRDGAVSAKVAWQQGTDAPSPVLILSASIDNGVVAAARNYFPRGLLHPPALNWLDRAFVAGHMRHADMVIRGPIRHFPFRDGSGLFLARLGIEGATLDYADGWPQAEGFAGQVEFRNEGMSAHILSGKVGTLAVTGGDARFADFKTGELRLHLESEGDAADGLGYLRATPLDRLAENAFSETEAKGPMRAEVDLFLPFKDFVHRQVLVHGHLDGVSINRTGSALTATDMSGDFDVDAAQVARADVHGRLLGGTFQMQARAPRSRPLTRTQLEFHGTLAGDDLRAAIGLPSSVAIDGQADWRAVLRMAPDPNRERSLRISSNLTGLAMHLPAPLDKSADAPMPSALDIQWLPGGIAQGRLALGSVVAGSYALASDANGMRLTRLALNFGSGESTATDAQVVNVGGSVARLDLAGWLKLTPAKSARPLSDYLRTARLNVSELDYLGLAFRDVSIDFAVADRALHIKVGGPNVEGVISLPTASDSAEPWSLQFAHLHFDLASDDAAGGRSDAPGGEAKAAARGKSSSGPADPRAIPAIDFHAGDLEWGEHNFGDVQAKITKVDDGISLESLAVTGTNFAANGKGEWRGKDGGTAHLTGSLTSTDVQDTLKELGYVAVVEAKDGRLDYDLSWSGAPTEAALADATGHIQLALDKGQVVGLKPGAGRVLGLTSVAALRRRLALDFSDLTDKGLAFDTIRGDFELRDGNARTENLLVKGPAAEIGLIGRVGLKNRDYDQTAVVTGSVGNSLPLAALAGGPVVAGAVLLFTQVFKQPLKGLARGYYRITGSWDNPIVERIKSADAAAATAEAPK
jgi:uncharacterized protein (TIGR02099 family)